MKNLIKLDHYLQEDVLAILMFSDDHFELVRNCIQNVNIFEPVYKEIAEISIAYIDEWHKPIRDKLGIELDSKIPDSERESYNAVIKDIYATKIKEDNPEYIIKKMTAFAERRSLHLDTTKAHQLILKGEIAEAKELLHKSLNYSLSIFDPGIRVSDIDSLFKDIENERTYKTGVKALDDMGVGPAAKQVFLFIAGTKKGKSWSCVHVGKTNVLNKVRVAHFTLEVSANVIRQRYIQSLLELAAPWLNNKEIITPNDFIRDGDSKLMTIPDVGLVTRRALIPSNKSFIQQEIKKYQSLLDTYLRLKMFPRGRVTVTELRGWLDSLESTEGFIPEVVIIDAPYHIATNVEHHRLDLGENLTQLGGLAMERNYAIFGTHQINREGYTSKNAGNEHIAEAFLLVQLADTVVVQNQTLSEFRKKLARITVTGGRSQASNFTVLINQNLDIGQFCLDSVLVPDNYNPALGGMIATPSAPASSNGRVAAVAD
jgi:hypothetical protein